MGVGKAHETLLKGTFRFLDKKISAILNSDRLLVLRLQYKIKIK